MPIRINLLQLQALLQQTCGNGLPSRQEQACMWSSQIPKVLQTQHHRQMGVRKRQAPLCHATASLHGMLSHIIAVTIATTYKTCFVATAPSSNLPMQTAYM